MGVKIKHSTAEFEELGKDGRFPGVPGMCPTQIECARIVPWCAREQVGKTLQVVDL